jgi:ribosomal protein L32
MVNVMKKKMREKRKHKQVIIPMRRECFRCGEKVKNHHFFCDDCWAQKERDKRKGRKKMWKWKKRNILEYRRTLENNKHINLNRSDIYKYRRN